MPLYYAPLYNFVTGNLNGSDVAYQNLTTGLNNVALGKNTLRAITVGSDNIAVGFNALSAVTTGGSNVAIGSNTLQNLTTGSSNVAIDATAGNLITTGSYNVLIGGTAGNNIITSQFNNAVGYGALSRVEFSNTPAASNNAFGTSALGEVDKGYNNTGIGDSAGFQSVPLALVNSSNCTFLGANAGLGIADTGALNFATAIGAGAVVSAANTVVVGRAADTVSVPGNLGAISKYAGNALVANGLSSIVAKHDATAQSANIGATVVLAAAPGGFYTISAYAVVTTAATTSSTLPNVNVIYTDNDTGVIVTALVAVSSTLNTVGTANSTAGGANTSAINVRAGTNISVSTTGYASVGVTAMQYAEHTKLEYMGV